MSSRPPWPYPVRYGRETEAEFDVLVVGGRRRRVPRGHQRRPGAGREVAVLDKGPVIRSGSGGAGCDHWHGAVGNPCCDITPEEFARVVDDYPFGMTTEYGNGITCYIMAKESYDDPARPGEHGRPGARHRRRVRGVRVPGRRDQADVRLRLHRAAHPAGVRLGVQAGAAPGVEAPGGDRSSTG